MALLHSIVVIAAAAVVYAAPQYDNLSLGVPGPADQIVERRGYALGFQRKHKQPLWVAYKLTVGEVTSNVVGRAGSFEFDSTIVGGSATLEDYRGSGFDRGHLAPAADMKWDPVAMRESFYLSNVSPQVNAFNSGIWKRIEEWCRGLAVRRGSLYIVTGPVFPADEDHVTIGQSKVTVPHFFYKVVYDDTPPGCMIGFIVPNKAAKNIYRFAVSVDDIEEATGLDFFSNLPDDLESRLESECNPNKWNK